MLSRLYRIQVIVTFIIPFNRYVWSRYSYSAYKLLLVGLFVPLSFITCTSILKYANLSKLFWKNHIISIKEWMFLVSFFFKFPFFSLNILLLFKNMVEMMCYPSFLWPKQEIQQNTRNHCKLVLISIGGVLL